MGRGREPWERSKASVVNDNERHLHHLPVSIPIEELWKDKRRRYDSGRWERTRPGFYLCFMCGSCLWGAAAFILCLLLKSLNVCQFLPSSSRIYELCYIDAETREEGGTRYQRALAAEGDRSVEEVEQQEEAETASSCPRWWCWSNRRIGGTEGSLQCSSVEEGWLPFKREQRIWRHLPGGRSLLLSAMFGEEQGMGDSLPKYWTKSLLLQRFQVISSMCCFLYLPPSPACSPRLRPPSSLCHSHLHSRWTGVCVLISLPIHDLLVM